MIVKDVLNVWWNMVLGLFLTKNDVAIYSEESFSLLTL